MDNIKNLLAHEIADATAALSTMEKGSTEYGNLVADIVKLMAQFNEMERNGDDLAVKEESLKLEDEKLKLEAKKLEFETKKFGLETEKLGLESEKLEFERDTAEKDRENARNNRLLENGLKALDIGTKVILFVWACNTAWKWERTDTMTNTPGKEVGKSIFHLKLW